MGDCGHPGVDWDSHYFCMKCFEVVPVGEVEALRTRIECLKGYIMACAADCTCGAVPSEQPSAGTKEEP